MLRAADIVFPQSRNALVSACEMQAVVVEGGVTSERSLLVNVAKFKKPRGKREGDTPQKINIEPENDGLEDDFPFPGMYSQVPC